MLWYNNELVSMAKEIGYRLLPAFNTSTGIPYPRVSCAWLWNKIHVFVNYSIQWLNFWTNQEIRWSKIWSPIARKQSIFLLAIDWKIGICQACAYFILKIAEKAWPSDFGQWTWNLAIASSSGALTDTWIRSRFLVQLLYFTCTWPSVCFLICWVHLRSWLLWDDFRGVWGN